MTAWQERQDAEREEWPGKWPAHGLVFALQDGSALHPDYLSRAFRAHGKRAKLPTIRLHDLRHTHATQLLKAGVHPKVVSERLGHASIGITLDTYSHVMPGMQEETPRRSTRDLGRHWLDRRDWHQDEEMMRGSSETV